MMRASFFLVLLLAFLQASCGQLPKKALIFGVTGQDGSYLCEFLLEKGYEVHGVVRRASIPNTTRIDHLINDQKLFNKRFFIHYGDVSDFSNVVRIVREIAPDEVYNLSAQSFVYHSFEAPELTAGVDALGVLHILEAVRQAGLEKTARVYQASTSELYGKVEEIPQNEKTPFHPRSPYGVAKLYGFWLVRNYRESYNMHASNGILFNHESPRRGEEFVTRKITRGLARILHGKQEYIALGNLNAKRDWGYAKEYVEGMWRILQQAEPNDYVMATGETHTVREFAEKAFQKVGITLCWTGDGIDEVGKDEKTGKIYVRIDPKMYRPAEVDLLIGDNTFAREKLGWAPKVTFSELVDLMVESDLKQESLSTCSCNHNLALIGDR